MRNHKLRSKIVLNELNQATNTSTRVVDNSISFDSRIHPYQESGTPRRRGRIIKQPKRYMGLTEAQVVITDDNTEDPLSFKGASDDVDKDEWIKAMNLEIETMHSNSLWELVDPPDGVRPIDCKWIYKRKRGIDGKVQIFKARLVAKEFNQREGLNHEDTFSPVAMLKFICILLSIAIYFDYEVWKMDGLLF